MITTESLKAPFTKITSLITLLSVISLFVVFRLAGGLIYLSNSNINDPYAVDNWGDPIPEKSTQAAREQPAAGDDYLNELLQRQERSRATAKPIGDAEKDRPKPSAPQQSAVGLDEIERNLGLK